jgi:hypothetical protein
VWPGKGPGHEPNGYFLAWLSAHFILEKTTEVVGFTFSTRKPTRLEKVYIAPQTIILEL